MVALLIGCLGCLSVLVVVWGWASAREEEERLRVQSVRGSYNRQAKKKGFLESLHQNMVFFAREIGHPEWADIAYRVSFAMPLLVAAILFVIGWYWAMPLSLCAFFLPYFYLNRVYKRARLLLKRQLRQARLLIALLTEAGAPIERSIAAAESVTSYPLKPYLRDVSIAIGASEDAKGAGMRVQTVVEAFMGMAERLHLPEATQFAQLLTQSARYNTPLVDMMFTSLDIEERIRDTEAELRYNNAISKISYISTLGLGIPVFGYLFLAVFSYALQILGNGFGISL